MLRLLFCLRDHTHFVDTWYMMVIQCCVSALVKKTCCDEKSK